MKKVLLVIVAFSLSNCDISVRKTNAQSEIFYQTYTREIVEFDGMKYLLLYVVNKSSQTGYSITTINLTKDKLEVELLRHQLTVVNCIFNIQFVFYQLITING